jgi:hypothetical protein
VVKTVAPQQKMTQTEMNNVSNLMNSNDKNIRELLNAILLQNKPYALPRPVGAYVAPHQLPWKFDLTLRTPSSLQGAFVITNDPDNFLLLSTAGLSDIIPPGNYVRLEVEAVADPPNNACLFQDDIITEGGNVIHPELATIGFTNDYYNISSQRYVPGTKFLPGNYDFSLFVAGDLTLSINNAENGAVESFYGYGHVSSVNGDVIQDGSASIALASGASTYDLFTDPGFVAFKAIAINPALSKGIWFAIGTSNGHGSYIMNVGVSYILTLGLPLPITTPVSYVSHSIWSLLPNQGLASKAQFDSAARYNVTGNHVVFSNNTAEILSGGNIYAARLPGNSFVNIPSSFLGLTDVINSQTHHHLISTSLSKGCAYSFTPEKTQDWLFDRVQTPQVANRDNCPYFVCVYDASSLNLSGAFPTFVLKGVMSIEYLSTDVSQFYVSTPSNSILYDALLNALACENTVSENPDHLKNIASVVKNVMTSDNIKMVMKLLVQTGIKVAPMVLSLL